MSTLARISPCRTSLRCTLTWRWASQVKVARVVPRGETMRTPSKYLDDPRLNCLETYMAMGQKLFVKHWQYYKVTRNLQSDLHEKHVKTSVGKIHNVHHPSRPPSSPWDAKLKVHRDAAIPGATVPSQEGVNEEPKGSSTSCEKKSYQYVDN